MKLFLCNYDHIKGDVMEIQAALQPAVYEQTLMSIVRTLPTERIVQVVDFARFMQSQVLSHDVFIDEEETEEEIRADNERWDATFAASGDTLRMLANQAREEIRAGRSRPMIFTDDGRIAPG